MMSVWDGDENFLNLPLPTMGGQYFWNTIREEKEYIIQQHKGTKHCRILNKNNIRVAWGDEGPMLARFYELTNEPYQLRARYGDIIGVHRAAGIYDHYGVYASDNCIYEYGISENGESTIHITTLKDFVGLSDGYFILVFPQTYGALGKIHIGESKHSIRIKIHRISSSNQLIPLWKRMEAAKHYRIYSPQETITRAKSRIGEKKYNLFFRNCEHFAIWCKTGMADSHQIASLLNNSFFNKPNPLI